MSGTYAYVWEFTVDAAARAEFEREYGAAARTSRWSTRSLDRECEGLTSEERALGCFTELTP